ncbi:hypothetical protein EV363DRAFT_852322 [Boletus edulis]|nr:hypothetical protein EV363DRAFT_852322 [Boletus edulis]
MPDSVKGGAWTSENPIATDAWKRAVYKRPPKFFHVTLLPPEKHGSGYSFGFRIRPIKDDNASIMTHTSSSGGSITSNEYDIWRKWEDCLYFQDGLEVEYARAAREKRSRLAAGKGVKKNGVYVHSDQAASWESLPFGPDPNDVARDIHQYIPKLSKKGTLFRASQETINQRYEEIQKMMHALLQDDLPTLIREIKNTLTFSDFFGIWRRDIDLARKAASSKKPVTTDRARPSLSPSIISAFPVSPSSHSAKPLSPAKGKEPEKARVPFGTYAHSDASSSEDCVYPSRPSRLVDRKQEVRSTRSRGSSSDSHSSSSLPSTPVTIPRQLPPNSRQPVIASQEVSLRFEHNPHVLVGERRSSCLESLPEGRELSSSPKSDPEKVLSRNRSESTASRMNRSARIYVHSLSDSPQSSAPPSEPSARSLSRYPRTSSATLRATAYLDELGVDYCLPSPTPEPRCRSRASVSSMASLVTNASVDAVIPRNERPSRSLTNYAQRSLSHSEESWDRHEPCWEDDSEDQGDILDAYFCDLIRPCAPTPDGFPETPAPDEMVYRVSQAPSSSTATFSSFSRFSDRRSSLTTSISSGSTSSSRNSMTLSIKAIHEDNIVMLRLPRYTAFDDLRRNIYDKFMQTDNATICDSFAIALLAQAPAPTENSRVGSVRPRAGSLSSLRSAHAKGAALHFISSQDDWDDAIATYSGKMLLRIIGSRE